MLNSVALWCPIRGWSVFIKYVFCCPQIATEIQWNEWETFYSVWSCRMIYRRHALIIFCAVFSYAKFECIYWLGHFKRTFIFHLSGLLVLVCVVYWQQQEGRSSSISPSHTAGKAASHWRSCKCCQCPAWGGMCSPSGLIARPSCSFPPIPLLDREGIPSLAVCYCHVSVHLVILYML